MAAASANAQVSQMQPLAIIVFAGLCIGAIDAYRSGYVVSAVTIGLIAAAFVLLCGIVPEWEKKEPRR